MARIFVNGTKLVAWATGITINEQIQNMPVTILGSLYSQELVPTHVSVGVSIETVHIMDQSIVSRAAGDSGIYPQGDTEFVALFPECTIVLYDQFGDKARATVYGCKAAQRTIPLGRGGVMATSVRFDALRFEQND